MNLAEVLADLEAQELIKMTVNKILSDVIHYMKYANYDNEINRRETFSETCDRNMNMHIRKFPFLADKIEGIYENFVKTKKFLPAMRSMQFAGEAIERNNVRIFNCSYSPADDKKIFSESMFLLLSGCGFGYSVQHHHIEKLPVINQPIDSKIYHVSDSIEGWADAVDVLINAYLSMSHLPDFDFSLIRKKGSEISTGGKAPGHEPLKVCLENIDNLFKKKIENRENLLTSIDCHSIFCYIADAVLSGGIRRAAMIALFSFDDYLMRNCKSGSWWLESPHFARANNSAIILYDEITKDQFKDLWQDVENSGSGEPGIIWTNDRDYGYNPCFTGDMRILSDKGNVPIGENVGTAKLYNKNGEIVNGRIWSNGVKPTVKLRLSNQVVLKCTKDHRYMTVDGSEVEAQNLLGLRVKPYFVMNTAVSKYVQYGFIQGDGALGRLNSVDHTGLEVNIGVKDKEIFALFGITSSTTKRSFYIPNINQELVDLGFSSESLPNRILPTSLNTWSTEDKYMFLKGMYSANGSVIKGARVSYKSTCKDLIESMKSLLVELGIESYYTTNKSKSVEFANGSYVCKESYDLNITKLNSVIAFAEKIGFVHGYKMDALSDLIMSKAPKVLSIKDNGSEEVFDFNLQDDTHWGVIEGVIAHNCAEASLRPFSFCNLVEINAEKVNNQKDFNDICDAASFINTIQASYTDFHYLRDIWTVNTKLDSLIGVGITGIASGNLDNIDLALGAEIVMNTNKEVSKLIGINPSARCTLIKPAGTSSLILETSSGIHDYFDSHYLRRVRVNKRESIYDYFLEYLPSVVENDNFDINTAIFTFPQKAPESGYIRDKTNVMDLLTRVQRYNIEWIRSGHRSGSNYHNVSATISIKPDEWHQVGSWMWDNRFSYHGLSVLPYDGGTYQQAPFESCSKEIYSKYLSYFDNVNIDLSMIQEFDDNTNLNDQVACSSGVCELI